MQGGASAFLFSASNLSFIPNSYHLLLGLQKKKTVFGLFVTVFNIRNAYMMLLPMPGPEFQSV